MKTGYLTRWQKMSRRKKAQAMVEFALALPFLLMVLFGLIEFGRLLYAWIIVENSARFGLRFATTGQYDPQYCPTPGDITSCTSPANSDDIIDAARIPSTKDAARQIFVGLPIDQNPSPSYTDDNYLNFTVCANTPYTFIPPQMGGTDQNQYASCSPGENASTAGQTVIVSADYNFTFVILPHLPFLSGFVHMIHLSAYRTGLVEEFRASRSINTPLAIQVPLQTPTNTPAPTLTFTPAPTATFTQTYTPTITDTFTNTPTITVTDTATISPTPTVTNTPTMTLTPTITNTPTMTKTSTPTKTPTLTFTPSKTATITNTPTKTFTPTITFTPSNTPTKTLTPTITNTPTKTLTPTITNTPTKTFTPTITNTPTKTNTPTNTATITNTPTKTATSTITNTPTNTPTKTNTPTNTPTKTNTPTNTPTKTNTPTNTPVYTPTNTPTPTPTVCFNNC